MTAACSSPSGSENGYLLQLRAAGSGKTRAWLLLLTEGFEPLARLSHALGALGDEAKGLAAENDCWLEERSISREDPVCLDDDADAGCGRVADLREYTYADGAADPERLRWHLELLLSGRPVPRLVPVTGAVARAGESLFGRAPARADLLGKLEEASVMLLGPRRCGKTSLLQWLVDEPPQGRRALYLDLERVADGASLAVELCFAMGTDPVLGSRLGLEEVKDPSLGPPPEAYDAANAWRQALYQRVKGTWREFLTRLWSGVSGDPAPLVLLDEFGDFLEAIAESPDFNPFLSFVEQSLGGVGLQRVVVTGSRSLEYLIERRGLQETFQRFVRFPIPPFERDAARQLFEERLRSQGIRPSRDIAERALSVAGHQVPYYLQLLADSVLTHAAPGDLTEAAGVDLAYRDFLLGYPGQTHFDDLERRLKGYEQYRKRRAGQQTLRFIAERGEVPEADLLYRLQTLGLTQDEVRSLLVLLEEYFFVEKSGGCWRFQVPVLRDYALRYYPESRL